LSNKPTKHDGTTSLTTNRSITLNLTKLVKCTKGQTWIPKPESPRLLKIRPIHSEITSIANGILCKGERKMHLPTERTINSFKNHNSFASER